jgi:hypothetical protein
LLNLSRSRSRTCHSRGVSTSSCFGLPRGTAECYQPTPRICPPVPDAHGYQYFYDGSTLTDLLGTERYTVPSALAAFLEGLTPAMPAIENQEPAGSLLWWPVMAGGGLVAIAAAVWLQRRVGKA